MTPKCRICNAPFSIARAYLTRAACAGIGSALGIRASHPMAKVLCFAGGLLVGELFEQLQDEVCPSCRA